MREILEHFEKQRLLYNDVGERLRECCCFGDEEGVKKILEGTKVNVNSQNKVNGWTALHWAAKRGYVGICVLLLKHGANRDIINASNQIPSQLTNNAHLHNLLSPSHQSIPTPAINYVSNEESHRDEDEEQKQEQEVLASNHVHCHPPKSNDTSIESGHGDTNNITDTIATDVVSSEIALQPHSATSIDDGLSLQCHEKEGYNSCSSSSCERDKNGSGGRSKQNSWSGSDTTGSGISKCHCSSAVVVGALDSDVETLAEQDTGTDTRVGVNEETEEVNPNPIAAAEQSQLEHLDQSQQQSYSLLSSSSVSSCSLSASCFPPAERPGGVVSNNNNTSCNNLRQSKATFDEQRPQQWPPSDSGNNSSSTACSSTPQKAPKIANTCHQLRHVNNINPSSLHSSNTTSKHPITERASNNHPKSDKITTQQCYFSSSGCHQNSNPDSSPPLLQENFNNLSRMPQTPINLVPSYMSRVRPPTTATCGSLSSYNEDFTYPWKKLQTKAHSMPITPPNNSSKSENASQQQSPLVQNNSPSIYNTAVPGASNYLSVIKNGTNNTLHNNSIAPGSASNFDMNPSPVASGSGIFSSNESVPIAVGETHSGNMELPIIITSGGRILKVRVSDQCDKDFVEIDLPPSKLSIQGFLEVSCQELGLEYPVHIERIRKLPNTRLRRDIEVQRLANYQELELVLSKYPSAPLNSTSLNSYPLKTTSSRSSTDLMM